MTHLEPDQHRGWTHLRWVLFFLFLSIQSIPTLMWIAALPADPKNSILFGFSLARLGLLLATGLAGLFFLIAAILTGKKESRLQSVFQDRWSEGRTFYWLEGIAILIALTAWIFLVVLHSGPDGGNNALFIRFQPFLVWMIALGFQCSIWFWVQCYGWHPERITRFHPVFISTGVVSAVFLVLTALIGFSGWGITPDIFYWGNPGVPLLSWQVWGSMAAGLILLTILVSFPVIREYQKRLDWIIGGGLYVIALILWLSQPIPHSYFFPTPRAPNFQLYPYSDAGFYDYASQSLLIGEGFLNGQIVTRPLYILFLAILHGIQGQNFNEIIILQTFVLAIFPASLYWLGRSMRSREAGLAAGLLAIFREMNAIAATPLTEVSHSKMLMTDSLTGLGICLFCLAVFRWSRKTGIRPVRSTLIGGFLGLLLLLRSQAIFLIPVVLLLLVLQKKGGWRGVFLEAGLFLAGAILAVSPWIIRNGLNTGDYAFDQPSQAVYIAQRFAGSVSESENIHLAAKSSEVNGHILNYVINHPVDVVEFIGAHFINNELDTLVVLPLKVSLFDFHDNLQISTLFWLDGIKGISGWQWLFLAINLIFIAIGIGSSWSKWKWAGLLPLAFQIAYSLSSAVARISGWRFIQPVDWIGYFYFCLGFSELIVIIFAGSNLSLRPREKDTREVPSGMMTKRSVYISLAVTLFAGMQLPIAEWIIPQRYTSFTLESAIQVAHEAPKFEQVIGSDEEFLKQSGAVRLIGRALYPRWYKSGGGEPGSGWAAYKARDDAHLGFMTVGPDGDHQMMLSQTKSPTLFPHASDVIVYGCKKNGFIDVKLVVGYTQPDIFAYTSDHPSNHCDQQP